MFDTLYVPYRDEVRAFGSNWCGPEKYEGCTRTLIARYVSEYGSDGQTAEVFCYAVPARFYQIHVLAGENSVGEPTAAYEVRFGSSKSELVAEIAQAIAEEMIGFYPTAVEAVAEGTVGDE